MATAKASNVQPARLTDDDVATLDILVRGGIASTRSAALAYCVRYVAEHESELLEALGSAIAKVDVIRQQIGSTS